MNDIPIVERAFQLAKEGLSSTQLRAKLQREGYPAMQVAMHLSGSAIIQALRRAAKGARTQSAERTQSPHGAETRNRALRG